MDELMDKVKRAITLGHAALQKGLWELGLARYSYAAGLIDAFFTLSQTGEIDLTEQEDLFLASSLTTLEDSIERIRKEWGNGHHNPPNRGLAKAAEAILKELDRIG